MRRLYGTTPPPQTPQTKEVAKKKSLWTRVKEEAEHYWLGTKLLAKESSISTRLLWRMSRGISLTRREHNQLVRTAKDLFRLIPFAVFVIVPFMELLLPVALKLFPNMLPSTYSSAEKEEAQRRQVMASKLQMAKFLRDSIAEAGIHAQNSPAAKAQEFATFFKKYRSSGERASTAEVMEICKKFRDDLTLDNLSRPQLITLARFMGVNAFGTDNFIRYILRNRMEEIKKDDKMILAEGVDSLTVSELVTACQTRGIRAVDVSPERLRYELQQWLDLHLKNDIPPSLLVLSRALMMTDRPSTVSDTVEALQTTLTSLPNEIVEEAQLRLSEAEGTASIKKKLEIIQKEEQKIADERAEAEKDKEKEKEQEVAEELIEKATNENLTEIQAQELEEQLQTLSKETKTDKERKQLQELKEDREKFIQEEASSGVPLNKTKSKQLKELEDLIKEIDDYLNDMDVKASLTPHIQDITTEELSDALKTIRHPPNEERIKKIVKKLDKDGDGKIFLDDILQLSNEVSVDGDKEREKKETQSQNFSKDADTKDLRK